MSDIVKFLRARLDEDEQEARDAGADAMIGHRWKRLPETDYNAIQHATIDRCRRVLREVEAKRRILDIHYPEWTGDAEPVLVCHHDQVAQMRGIYPCITVCNLAAMYAGHPDYDPEWRE